VALTWPMSLGMFRGSKLIWLGSVPASRMACGLGEGVVGKKDWVVGEKASVVGGRLVVRLWPEGWAWLFVLICPPPGRLCWSEVWKTPVFWLKDSWLSN
jgi:hypothetical protein